MGYKNKNKQNVFATQMKMVTDVVFNNHIPDALDKIKNKPFAFSAWANKMSLKNSELENIVSYRVSKEKQVSHRLKKLSDFLISNNIKFGEAEDFLAHDALLCVSQKSTVNNTNEGLLRLADQFSASAKTLLGGFLKRAFDIDDFTTLSKTELSNRLAQGKMQGLIGRFRIETVGGGVMTEQDALRIIANLGGDVNLLQNKEIVAQQLASLYEDKVKSLNRKTMLHNNAVKQVYSESGYEKIEPFESDKSIFTPDRSVLEPKNPPPTGGDRKLSDDDLRAIITTAMQSGAAADLSNVFGPDLARYQEILSEMISQPVD